jgi:hypothetical protein
MTMPVVVVVLGRSAADSGRTEEMMLRLGALECVGEMAIMACEAIAVGVVVGGRTWCDSGRQNVLVGCYVRVRGREKITRRMERRRVYKCINLQRYSDVIKWISTEVTEA